MSFPYSGAHTHCRLPIQGLSKKTVSMLTLHVSVEIKAIHWDILTVSQGGEPHQPTAPRAAGFSWDPQHLKTTAFKIIKHLSRLQMKPPISALLGKGKTDKVWNKLLKKDVQGDKRHMVTECCWIFWLLSATVSSVLNMKRAMEA